MTTMKFSERGCRQISWQGSCVWIAFGGLALLVLFSLVRSPQVQTWLLLAEDKNSTLLKDAQSSSERSWNTWTTRAAEWEARRAVADEEDQRNWAGRQMMRKALVADSVYWDKRAEQYFISKLEKSQFPDDCSQAHWIAHYDYNSGLLSSVHLLLVPLFFSMVRGHPLVPISEPKRNRAFDGCGVNLADRNTQCYFNVTNCQPADDPLRLPLIQAEKHDKLRSTWEELLMEEDDFFPEGGVTVTQTFRQHVWDTTVCVGSSPFSSFREAYSYHKFSLFEAMGRHGKVGVVTDNSTRARKTCSRQSEDSRSRRVEMVMVSLMSSWMLNQMHSNVKLVADKIMSRYEDSSGQPLWKPPVLVIHIRQTDKLVEDPYYIENGIYRPIQNYAEQMREMEKAYGFEWPTIFVISDSGTARESLVAILHGNVSTADSRNSTKTSSEPEEKKKRFIMYDWIEDDHLQEKFHDHTKVPKSMKHDMQLHFLATLYIVQKIADHAIVTYSSNVGRFIGEIMAAKHRLAYADPRGPVVTSLDYPWFWA